MSVSLQSGCEIKHDHLLQAVAGQFEDRSFGTAAIYLRGPHG